VHGPVDLVGGDAGPNHAAGQVKRLTRNLFRCPFN
jgi:hypothetical protein